MKETVLPELLAFLAKAPALEGITLRTEEAGPAPDAGGLWPRGVTVLSRKENLLGTVTLRCRAEFLLRLCLPLPPGDDRQALRNAGRLLALQGWVARQSAAHALPRFGDGLPERETLRAEEGRLEKADAAATARYTLRLLAEYTEIYKEETQ